MCVVEMYVYGTEQNVLIYLRSSKKSVTDITSMNFLYLYLVGIQSFEAIIILRHF
jgi:hypothetical protein